ncbi:MAG: methionine adenosyltransferase [Gemmatimonadota bacterium]|jgi:S-adenosylmethionine synthetase|nr:methionine adenosyltransferase [Gemmatimonadota bacterium]MDP6529950.1 methionine adenosyltransferase [Gemmatimonadota bacterium]MDP6802272.1 methionine adenosyltransferase [Gemmatimonadota bacterium]MDP7031995.1 methionine adenosyltransferase [Gemmatimonadota bacterium]
MSDRYLFTSESVTEGHPDKVADQISDGVLDALLEQDAQSRVACETMVTTGIAIVSGEITTKAYVEIPDIVRNTLRKIGYDSSSYGIDWETCAVMTTIDRQSEDIALGVNAGEGLHKAQGAGDQGLMFGYATDETPELMPLPISLAHGLCRQLASVRHSGEVDFFCPDGKSQVTVEYEGDRPVRIDTVVVSTQHKPDVTHDQIEAAVRETVIDPVLPKELVDPSRPVTFHVNPTGQFVAGGPHADCGLTGRKIIVDTYGGMGRHGGGAFSGKDPSKVDRSASYGARYVAKNLVAAGLARRCEVQVAYAIGVAEPVSIRVETFGTGVLPETEITQLVRNTFDLTPAGLIGGMDLLRPIYQKTAAYGHFGREGEALPWEERDRVEALTAAR